MASTRLNFNVYDGPVSIQPSKHEQYPNAPVFSAYQLTGLYDLPHTPIIPDDDLEFADEIFRGKNLKSLRFLLTKKGEMRFGREGKPLARQTPSHALLPRIPRENCLSAGNIFVDPQHQICKITNKSSNYKEDGQALQFAIAAFYILSTHHAGIHFAPTIMLEIIKQEHCGGILTFTYSRDELIDLAKQLISHYRSFPSFYSDNAFLFDYTAEKIALWRALDTEEKENVSSNRKQKLQEPTPLFPGSSLKSIFDECADEKPNVERLSPVFLDNSSLFDSLSPEHDKENIPLKDTVVVHPRKKPRSLYNNFSSALFTSNSTLPSSESTSSEVTQKISRMFKGLNEAM